MDHRRHPVLRARAARRASFWLLLLLLSPAPLQAYELSDLTGTRWRIESVGVSRLATYRGPTELRWNASQLLLDPRRGGRLPGGFRLRLGLSTGSIRTPAEAEAGSFVSLGPEFQRSWTWNGATGLFTLGISPTLLSQDEFEGQKLGGNVHFTSAAMFGVFLDAPQSLLLSYRIQHTSNGRLHRTNPGVDVIGVELRYYGRR